MTPGAAAEAWAEHREAVVAWAEEAARVRPARRASLFDVYW